MNDFKIGNDINGYKIIQKLNNSNFGENFLVNKKIHNSNTGISIDQDFILNTYSLTALQSFGFDLENIKQELNSLIVLSGSTVAKKYMCCYYEYFIWTTTQNSYLTVINQNISGINLKDIILRQIDKGVAFDQNNLLKMMMDIAEAVNFLHYNNIAHQNIKPSNIMLDNLDGRLKLVDLTLSCSFNLNATCLGKPGTVYYMSPEVLTNVDLSFDYRKTNDIWSMGVVFYQMANLNQDYMNFKSNDPELLTKDIQLLPVNNSNYYYQPINGVINTILNKDPNARPTSTQVIIMLKAASPLCVVNNKEYNREEAIGLILSLDIAVDTQVDDKELCKILTDYFMTCNVRSNQYDKKQLMEIAKMCNLTVPADMDVNDLCYLINNELKEHQEKYSIKLTDNLVYIIEILMKLKMVGNNNLFDNIYKNYISMYTTAKQLNLINFSTLIDYWKDTNVKLSYYKNLTPEFAALYNSIALTIADIIIEIKPDTNINGVPINEYQKQVGKQL
jgi:serine/threonine protein kinase